PLGQRVAQGRAEIRVCIVVREDIEPTLPCRFPQTLNLRGLSDAAIFRVVVADLHRTTGALADVDAFSDRVDDRLSLSPDVRGVEAAATSDALGELDGLTGGRETSRRIHQAGAHAERAGAHRLVDLSLHGAHFTRCRRPLLEAHRREPHAPVAREARDVDPNALAGHEIEIFGIGRPVPIFRLSIVLEPADREVPISLADRRGRIAAVPDYMGRDPLADRALRGGLDEDSDIAVRVNVDETRSDVLPGCGDGAVRLRTTAPA